MLEKKTQYTKKDGSIGNFSKPNMKVMGKLMDQNETLKIVVLSNDGVRTTEPGRFKFDKHSLFVKDFGDVSEDGGYYLANGASLCEEHHC